MAYKIVKFDSVTGRIDVEFDAEIATAFMLPIDAEGKVPTGEALDKFINTFAPTAELERRKNIQATKNKEIVNADEITALVEISDFIVDPILDVSLIAAVAYSLTRINALVTILRQRYVTGVTGQDFTYIAKVLQAQAYQAANYQGNPPAYIAKEIEVTGDTAQAATDAILTMYTEWTTIVDPLIEAARIEGKRNVFNAKNNQEVDTAFRACILKLQGIGQTYPVPEAAVMLFMSKDLTTMV